VRFLAVIVSLCASTCAIAAERATVGPPSRQQILECDKNHYILDEPCRMRATEVAIGYVGAVAVSPAGEVHFSSPHVVYRIDADGFLIRVAGTGRPGLSGDGGPAVEARLNFPQWYPERENDPMDWSELLGPLAFDPDGNLYIGDAYNNRVRRIDTRGVIETVDADTWLPQGVAVGPDRNLYVSDGTGRLRRIAPDGKRTTLAGNNCGHHRAPGLCAPQGIAVDPAGNAFVADGYCRIRLVAADGSVRTFAGNDEPDGRGMAFTCGLTGDGPAATAALSWPSAVALDGLGNLVIADTYNHCIRRVDSAGMLTTIAGRCINNRSPVRLGDGGPARDAQLEAPHGVAVDAAGNIYIADTANFRVRKIDVDGIITTIAGNGEPGCEMVTHAWGLPGCATP